MENQGYVLFYSEKDLARAVKPALMEAYLEGSRIDTAGNLDALIALASRSNPRVVVCDDACNASVVRSLRASGYKGPVVAALQGVNEDEALALGVTRLAKSAMSYDLADAVRQFL